jgi:hypothetical protein
MRWILHFPENTQYLARETHPDQHSPCCSACSLARLCFLPTLRAMDRSKPIQTRANLNPPKLQCQISSPVVAAHPPNQGGRFHVVGYASIASLEHLDPHRLMVDQTQRPAQRPNHPRKLGLCGCSSRIKRQSGGGKGRRI